MLPWKSRDRKQGKGRKVEYFNKYEMFHPEHVWKNNSSFFQKKKNNKQPNKYDFGQFFFGILQ